MSWNRNARRGAACSQLRFVAHEAGELCQCICDALGLGGRRIGIDDGCDGHGGDGHGGLGRDDRDDGSRLDRRVLGLGGCEERHGAVRHLVLVDTAAFASLAHMKCAPKSGVRLAFVSSVWDVSRAAEGLRGLHSVSVVVGAESSKRSVLRCVRGEGRFVYAALVEVARLTGLDTVHVFGIDAGVIGAYLDFNAAECDANTVTVLASGADWRVAWSSTGGHTRARACHADNLFSTRPVLSSK